jgi:putative transposase
VNVTLELPEYDGPPANGEIGIDLGLKDKAVSSNGTKVEASRCYRDLEPNLATAQRAGKKGRVQKIHRKIANRRKDANHKASTVIAQANGLIVVGNLSPLGQAKTSRAKSALDQGWSDLKNMLRYKAMARAGIFLEVNEAYTTQTCSSCLARSGPRGLEGLRIRGWTCDDCGTIHDRDVNAARNILRLGHETLAGGSPVL